MSSHPHCYPFANASAVGLTIVCLSASFGTLAGESGPAVTVGRYAVSVAAPSVGQQDLLANPVTSDIPPDIVHIGDAVRWLLRDSGYRLAEQPVLTADAHAMLQLPLPAVHRQVESLPLYRVLELLVGPAFLLVHDPVHRIVSFERCKVASALPPAVEE